MAYLYGTSGNDSLKGGLDDDYLSGDLGNDTLTGGGGQNTFVLSYSTTYVYPNWVLVASTDVVTDFVAGIEGDQIALPYFPIFNPYSSSSQNPFYRGYVRLTQSGADTLIELDIDGAAAAATYQTMMVLKNVNKSNLVAFNFQGFDPYPLVGTLAGDSLAGSIEVDEISGSDGNDTITGLDGNDILYGENGNDILDGGAGADSLFGGAGADKLSGGAGNDFLRGDSGNDTLTGGAGTDVFSMSDESVFPGSLSAGHRDIITDFAAGNAGDQISWSYYLGGGNPFATGYARLTQSGADTLLEVDLDGAAGSGAFQTLAILRNVDRNNLVAFNFQGRNPQVLVGTAAADSLTGSSGSDEIYGYAGNDSLDGGAGLDSLNGGLGDDTLVGGADNDSLYGEAGNDSLNGGAGANTLNGGLGNDTLLGGAEYDYLSGEDGNDSLNGGAGFNILYGGSGNDTLDGGDGTDYLYGEDGYDSLNGGAGNDYLQAGAGADKLMGGTGNDDLYGDSENDLLDGGAGTDYLDGGSGNDTLTGGEGSDTFVVPYVVAGSASATGIDTITDFLTGDAGDRISLSSYGAGNPFGAGYARLTQLGADTLLEIDADGATGAGAFQTVAILKNVNKNSLVAFNFNGFNPNPILGTAAAEILAGSSGFDEMYAKAGNDTVTGLDGNDKIYGEDGNDSLDGAAGADSLYGGLGADKIYGGTENDSLYGGDGNDFLNGGTGNDYLSGDAGNDTLTGGEGTDTFVIPFVATGAVLASSADTIADFVVGDTGDRISFSNSFSGGNPFATGFARLTQSGANTLLEVDADGTGTFQTVAVLKNVNKGSLVAANFSGFDPNPIFGTLAADSLAGTAGSEEIYAQAGNDTVTALAGQDRIYGDAGNDSLDGGAGDDTVDGGAGDDLLLGDAGIDYLLGGDGDDSLDGGDGYDRLYGGKGKDSLSGGAEDDSLHGEDGSDLLNGGAGADYLNGGLGNNTLTGGEGSDTFVIPYFSPSTTTVVDTSIITDFVAGAAGDRISLSYWEGGNPFATGYVRLTQSGADTLLEIDSHDASGPGIFQTAAILKNVNKASLVAANFGGFEPHPLIGTAAAESLAGTSLPNEIYGRAGNDTIAGLDGNDRILGEEGDDFLNGGVGADSLSGWSGADRLLGGADNDSLYGGDGNDLLDGGAGLDYLAGDSGADTLTGGEGSDVFVVSYTTVGPITAANVDTITDFVAGAAGDQVSLPYYSGNNPFATGYTRLTQSGADTLLEIDSDGEGAANTFQTVAILKNVNKADLVAFNFQGHDPHPVLGTAFADSLAGSSGADLMYGRAGNDTVSSLYGNDRIYGDDGNDRLDGGAGDDSVYGGVGTDTLLGGIENDSLYGGEGNDLLNGGAGADTLSGDVGSDTLTGGSGTDLFVISFVAAGSALANNADLITDFVAGALGDRISLAAYGYIGNGYYPYSGNNPFVSGYARLTQSGADTLLEIDADGATGAGAFQTVAILKNVNKNSLVAFNFNGFNPNPILGTAAAEILAGSSGFDEMYAKAGNDTVTGLDGNDKIYGEDGNDSLDGAAGADSLYGGDGNDFLNGGTGNDYLSGDAGNDTLTGGEGVDTFVIPYIAPGAVLTPNTDIIADFVVGEAGDRILFANYPGGVNPFAAAYARLTQSGANTLLEVDANGSGTFQTVAILKNVSKASLVAANFSGYEPHLTLGTLAADSLVGTGGSESIYARAGNDTVIGLGGNDRISGDDGNDYLDGSAGDDTAYGGAGDDQLLGDAGNDYLYGDDGNDILNGGAGLDYLSGGLGHNTLTGGEGSDTFLMPYLPPFSAQVVSTSVITDFAVGAAGDRISFSSPFGGNPFASGYARLTQSGADTRFEIDPDGESNMSTFQTLAILKNVNKASLDAFNFNGFEPNPIIGTAMAERLTGTSGANEMYGRTGDDTLSGLDGNDKIYGEDGNDSLSGGAGADELFGWSGADRLSGGTDNDSLYGGDGKDFLDGGTGWDYLVGGPGADTLTGGEGSDDFVISYSTIAPIAAADRDIITDFVAGANGDQISLPYYNGNNPFVIGYARLSQSGADTLLEIDSDGQGGPNTFQTVAVLRNVNKADLIAFNFQGHEPNPIMGAAVADSLAGSTAADVMYGFAGNDTVAGLDGNDRIYGGDGNDSLDGGAGHDILFGDEGADRVFGGADNDSLYGGNGNDSLNGGAGDDYLSGNAGRDTLTGGTGSDIFVIPFLEPGAAVGADADIITDFVAGIAGDQISLMTYGYVGSSYYSYGGNNPFVTGHARLTQSGANTLVELDADGAIGAGGFQTVAILKNVDKTSLVAFNFQAYRPDPIVGTSAADVLAGTVVGDELHGLSGNDTVAGLDGQDYLYGEDGNDKLDGGAGADYLYGDFGADKLVGGADNDYLVGGDGQDTLTGGAGTDIFVMPSVRSDLVSLITTDIITDFVAGSAGDQIVLPSVFPNLTEGNSFASGYVRLTQAGADTWLEVDADGALGAGSFQTMAILRNVDKASLVAFNFRGVEPNPISGTDLAESLAGTSGDNVMYGFAGNDTVSGLDGSDRLYGGSENDSLDGGAGIDYLYGGAGADRLLGGADNDTLMGDAGNDVLLGGLGSDYLAGGVGSDTLTGGAGSDVFDIFYPYYGGTAGSPAGEKDIVTDFVAGDAGDQIYLTKSPNFDDDSNPFATGYLRLTQSGADTLVEIDYDGALGSNTFQTMAVLRNVDKTSLVAYNFQGFEPNPILGTSASDVLSGSGGANEMHGQAGNDSLNGLEGNDTLSGGLGNDSLAGGAGVDTAAYTSASSGVLATLSGGGKATDADGTDIFNGIENLIGSRYNDSLAGNTLDNRLDGGAGNDTLSGAAGNDVLRGGYGDDVMTGGMGADRFEFGSLILAGADIIGSTRDVITDFNGAEGDRTDLSIVDADWTSAGQQDFSFIGSASFTAAGQVRYDAAAGMLYANVDADSAAEITIQLVGSPAFIADYLVA